jgi:carboxypeptidase family protein/carbohydrate-selective porin (OprB family)
MVGAVLSDGMKRNCEESDGGTEEENAMNVLRLCALARTGNVKGHFRSALIMCAVLGALVIFPARVLVAQPTGTISGVVKDSSGAVMPNVSVRATSVAAGTTVEATTDSEGRYRLDNVVQGSWKVVFAGTGFETDEKPLDVKAETAVVNVTLGMTASAQGGAPAGQQMPPMPGMPNMPAAGAAAAPQPSEELTEQDVSDPKALLAYIKTLEARIIQLETYAVMSVPETRTKRIEVYVDSNSNEYDHPVPGAKKVVTYQRERVYRRAEINEKMAAILAEEADKSVAVGVSGAIMPTGSLQSSGPKEPGDGRAYDLASADISFAARVAQNTTFFADLVGLTGPTPDSQIPSLTLLNSYTARLNRQNEVDVREAWIRTELFHQSLGISAGRLDLTNYFDRNAGANDETRQFLSDALVNNPVLGLTSNGAGVAVVYDPKRTFNFKFGFQQNNVNSPNLSQSIAVLTEGGYVMRPPGLQTGNYRVWLRTDNSLGGHKNATGLSVDQALTDNFMLFARFGFGYVPGNTNLTNNIPNGNMLFYSGGLQIQKRFVANPGDSWGSGYALTKYTSGAARENLWELYYNFQLTERLRFSPRVQYVRESRFGTSPSSFILPGVRLQVAF